MALPTLDGVALPDQLRWADRYSWRPVEVATRRTRGGRLHVHAASLSGGRPITLVADPDKSWWTADQANWIKGLAEEAGAVYDLVVGGLTYKVMIESIDFAPVYPMLEEASNLSHGDAFSGTLKLIEVL